MSTGVGNRLAGFTSSGIMEISLGGGVALGDGGRSDGPGEAEDCEGEEAREAAGFCRCEISLRTCLLADSRVSRRPAGTTLGAFGDSGVGETRPVIRTRPSFPRSAVKCLRIGIQASEPGFRR